MKNLTIQTHVYADGYHRSYRVINDSGDTIATFGTEAAAVAFIAGIRVGQEAVRRFAIEIGAIHEGEQT